MMGHVGSNYSAPARKSATLGPARLAQHVLMVLILLAILLSPIWGFLWGWHELGMSFGRYLKEVGWNLMIMGSLMQVICLVALVAYIHGYFKAARN